MFYTLISRIPYIYNIKDNNDKLFKIFLLGSICYVLLHALLYCKKYSEISLINNNKKLLFYLAGIDYSITLSLVFFIDKKKLEKSSEEKNKNKVLLNKRKKNKINSPFINKNEAVQLKNNYNDNESLKKKNLATSSLTLNTPENVCNNDYCEKPTNLHSIKENANNNISNDIKNNNINDNNNSNNNNNNNENENKVLEDNKSILDNKNENDIEIDISDTEFPVYN